MKKKWNQVAQGEILITRIDELPAGLTEVTPDNGVFVAGHSESGHHHVVDAERGVRYFRSSHPLVDFMSVGEVPTHLRHLRSFDTHKSHDFSHGFYQIDRQQEIDADDLWQPVID